MANRRWKDTLKFFQSRKSPEKEHLKWITLNNSLSPTHPQSLQYSWRFSNNNIQPKKLQFKALLPSSYPQFGSLWYAEPERLRQMDNSMKKILKLAKSMNHGSKERILKKNSELVHLVEDFHRQYQSIRFMYNELKGTKQNANVAEEDDSSSHYSSDSSGSDTFYTPNTSIKHTGHTPFMREIFSFKAVPSHTEDTGEVVKEALNVQPVASSSKAEEIDVDQLINESNLLREELDEKENEVLHLTKANQLLEINSAEKIKELDEQVDDLKAEIEKLNVQKKGLEGYILIKDDELRKMGEENLGLQDRLFELEILFREKGEEISAVLKPFNDNEKLLMDCLRSQKLQLERLLNEASKESEEIVVLQQELEKKSKEMSDFFAQVESSKQELEHKTAEEQRMKEEINSYQIQIKDFKMQVKTLEEARRMDHEAEQLILLNEQLNNKILVLQTELKGKEDERMSIIQKKTEDCKKAMEPQSKKDTTLTEDQNETEDETQGWIQKVGKLENKVAELENIVKENEDEMLVIKEEKREAIRQLCVLIDYHLGRYDMLKKSFSELIARNQVRAK